MRLGRPRRDQPQSPGKNCRYRLPRPTDEELDMPMSYGIRSGLPLFRSTDAFCGRLSDHLAGFYSHRCGTARRFRPLPTAPHRRLISLRPRRLVWVRSTSLSNPSTPFPCEPGSFMILLRPKGHPDNYFGFSLGSGIGIGRFIFDAAYVYRFGRDVGKSAIPGIKLSQDVTNTVSTPL